MVHLRRRSRSRSLGGIVGSKRATIPTTGRAGRGMTNRSASRSAAEDAVTGTRPTTDRANPARIGVAEVIEP